MSGGEMNSVALPRYRCHKEVHAARITGVAVTATGATLELELNEHEHVTVPVPAAYLTRHAPKAGGFYVVYDDGYASFSPAGPFEQGYTRVP